jgi:hypothetical protein
MAYNDFSLDALIGQFGLRVREESAYFAAFAPVPISDRLRETLDENVPVAVEVSTEKARSELIIMPVLMEVRRQFGRRISVFSGVEFNVDVEQGLRGVCDFLLSLSPLQLSIQAPVVAIVEAKNDNIKSGIGQCVAEMVAAQRFNRARGALAPGSVWGVVTTGSLWKFLRLTENIVGVDVVERPIQQIEHVVGIFVGVIGEAMAGAGDKNEEPAAP